MIAIKHLAIVLYINFQIMKNPIILLTLFFYATTLFSQNFIGEGGGEFLHTKDGPCLTEQQRTDIKEQLNNNRIKLIDKGILPEEEKSSALVLFDWPLRKTAGLNFNSYYATSNFVDHNPTYGGNQYGATNLDYNCGNRTYDTNGGYNHQGTDIVTWPFEWYMYENNLVEVVAGAAGTIIGKDDGNDDDHCSCSGNWNAVYIEHADGSAAWYGHLKKNLLTTKAVGQTVAKGEYLGVVASSGCSTGPHLHFEVYDPNDNLVDPYSGNCNGMNGNTTWWANQPSYREPTLNAVLTHDDAPVLDCPAANEEPHFSDTFSPGDRVYTAAYYHDQLQGDVSTMRIRRSDNSIWQTWTRTASQTYTQSYYYWSWFLPSNGPFGTWSFEVEYKGQIHSHDFEYVDPYCTNPGTNTWVGPTTANWNASGSYWSRGQVPKDCDNVVIPNGFNVTVPNGTTALCNTLEVQQGGDLYVAPNGVLDVQNP